MATTAPPLPIPISKTANRYLLHHAPSIAYLRTHHNIPGVLTGSLPQAPQQNLFLGLPLELMPEEARRLVELGVGVLVDDAKAQKGIFLGDASSGATVAERRGWREELKLRGVRAAREAERRGEERRVVGLGKAGLGSREKAAEGWNDVPEEMLKKREKRVEKSVVSASARAQQQDEGDDDDGDGEDEDSTLFGSVETATLNGDSQAQTPTSSSSASRQASTTLVPKPPDPSPYAITPTTSPSPSTLTPQKISKPLPLPAVPSSYPLYTHLHSLGYNLTPGLRFGANYIAYPGDPLRFHSHFLCKGLEWETEFDLLELVGGGRLGTGVKKGFLLGGKVEEGRSGGVGRAGWRSGRWGEVDSEDEVDGDGQGVGEGEVRCFCVEWAGM